MADGPELPKWHLRAVDYIGLGFLLLVPEELWRTPRTWYSWGSALALGVTCLWFGDAAPTIRGRIAAWWPWHQLRVARAELAKVRQENSEIHEDRGPAKAQHNVQCVGFRFISEEHVPLSYAALCFQNVPTLGKLMGKFEYPCLRVVYYENSTGQEIADLCPLQWYESENLPSEITADVSYAEIATFLVASSVWRLFEVNERSIDDLDYRDKFRFREVPAGEYRIIAILSGSPKLHISPVTGILTLGKDGTASFQRTTE